ncbi:hypothetical protein KOW79_006202 [Hemibagrus wyckioides]|uniref:Uncharacterized protein n=1 Tax=Hemibagrus wyckioides TaxID=337641 RepID=A0A9D3NWB4_9TELE|nr:hypothetical protein KOW79_006202 [Hemibagrus wyckioides]
MSFKSAVVYEVWWVIREGKRQKHVSSFGLQGRSVAPNRGQEATRCRQGASSSTHAEMTVTQRSVSAPAMRHGRSARLESCELTHAHLSSTASPSQPLVCL